MKRIYLLISAVAVSVVGVMGIASSVASADVLCDEGTYHTCRAGHVYPAGTEMQTELSSGSNAVLSYNSDGTYPEFTCGKSEIDMRIDHAGSLYTDVEATVTNLTFSACDRTPTVLAGGTAYINEYPAGTWNGKAQLFNNSISIKSRIFYLNCKVTIAGPGKITGPVWNKLTASTMTFSGATATSSVCGNMFFSGTYKFTSPTSVYAAE